MPSLLPFDTLNTPIFFFPEAGKSTEKVGKSPKVPQMPQGVDLNLDKFNLSRIEKFAGTMPAAAGTNGSLEAKVTLSKAFLKGLRDRNLDIKKTWGHVGC